MDDGDYCREILHWLAKVRNLHCLAFARISCAVVMKGSESANCFLVSFIGNSASIVASNLRNQHLEHHRNTNKFKLFRASIEIQLKNKRLTLRFCSIVSILAHLACQILHFLVRDIVRIVVWIQYGILICCTGQHALFFTMSTFDLFQALFNRLWHSTVLMSSYICS